MLFFSEPESRMLVLTLALFMSVTVPPLEELIQITEPWVRDDYTVTTQFEFHTSDFLGSELVEANQIGYQALP